MTENLEDPDFLFASSDKGKLCWQNAKVQQLVNLVREQWSNLQKGQRKKKFVWKEIGTALSGDGFTVSGLDCDRKWRNLKVRF